MRRQLSEKAKLIEFSEEDEDILHIHSLDCSIENIEDLERLRPFGHGFESPVFEVDELHVVQTNILKNQYPKWTLAHPLCALEAISFSLSKEAAEKKLRTMTGTLSINQFMSSKKAQLLVTSYKEAEK